MRDGTEAEISGGFKYGLTDDFSKILLASRQIKVVHLDSVGGRLGEGEKLFKLIRERGLTTYVSSKCMSACTLAFAGGRERYLLKSASLGFHKGAFPGVGKANSMSFNATFSRLPGSMPSSSTSRCPRRTRISGLLPPTFSWVQRSSPASLTGRDLRCQGTGPT